MFTLVYYYFVWHYSQAILDLIGIVRNLVWFFNEFFSMRLLASTLFVPFHRLTDDHKRTNFLDLGTLAENILVNTLMRFVGAILRLILIAMGIFFIVATLLIGAIMLIVWLLAPVMLVVTITSGLTFLAL